MPTFEFIARRGPGESTSGLLEADNRREALEKLSAKGFYPLRITEFEERGGRRWILFKAVSTKDLAFFTRQLADLLESNVPLLRALELLQEQTENATLKRLLQAIMEQIRGGKSFSKALESYPDLFSSLYIHLIYAGELGGMLPVILGRLADFIEQEDEFQSRILAALAYPSFVVLIGGVTVIFLMIFVVPRLSSMFTETGQGMPWMAQGLSSVSHLLSSWQGMLLLSLLVTMGLWGAAHSPHRTKTFLSRALARIPIWGSVMRKGMLARFTRTLAMLLAGGVPIIRALKVVSHVLDHPLFAEQIQKVTREVEQGKSFSESLRGTALFPVFICQMIAIGEEANTLEKVLEKVSATYERETDRAMKVATSLLEPVMIVGVGGVIGVIVIGMLLPIFQISTFVK